ncbi:Transmembrane emp24 domain-containing protein 10 [Mycoemilia scoparia]|uniref:Transmembrane emp24 domain-containing protein 10 n=1 Tax=Mycoemilia scoparia TaxID=417184 RepID=A0A9W8DLC3_9FUNG|nr:Transmembrane emp24 domain-containing protein 10 [Mycoemilia scoparia]
MPADTRTTTINFKMSSGASVIDFRKLMADHHIEPLEAELRKLASNVDDAQEQLQFLKVREADLRTLNESSNTRVTHLSIFTIVVLIAGALFQLVYLRRFFKAKKLI